MRILAAVAAALLALGGTIAAHDVPDDITLQAFLKPERDRVSLLVRVPLAAMRDVDVPTRASGYVDLQRVEPALRHAATVWLAQAIRLTEDGRTLGPGTVAAVLLHGRKPSELWVRSMHTSSTRAPAAPGASPSTPTSAGWGSASRPCCVW